MRKHFGKCALCGKTCELTFEHIPPRAAFNSHPAKNISGDIIIGDRDRMPWDLEGLHYENQQQGMGKYSLCQECNSNTGAWYGNAYIHVARIVHSMMVGDIPTEATGVSIDNVFPLQFAKQVLSMFCSINNVEDCRIEELRRFVCDKEATGLDKQKYKLCLYFTKSKLKKYAPLSAIIKQSSQGIESILVSELTAYPLGFLLYFDSKNDQEFDGIDISEFFDMSYSASGTVCLPLCIKEVNDLLPTLYRSRDEIRACIIESEKRVEENEDNKTP